MECIQLNNQKYSILKNVKDAVIEEEIQKKFTDYFKSYDYIVGDWAYGKLRLKGFNSKTNRNFKPVNDIDQVENYIQNYCAYECKYFILCKEDEEAKI